jgi:hypothetical protein
MVVESLYGILTTAVSDQTTELEKGGEDVVGMWEKHVLSPLGLDRVNKIFDSFATVHVDTTAANNTTATASGRADTLVMGKEDVMKWLLQVNGAVGRGSEYRAALTAMRSSSVSTVSTTTCQPTAEVTIESNSTTAVSIEPNEAKFINATSTASVAVSDEAGDEDDVTDRTSQVDVDPVAALPDDGFLTRAAFIDIYNNEISLGKVWGVAHDLAACGQPLPHSESVFSARYDRMYVNGLDVIGVRDTGGWTVKCLPNEEHPSDHLPISGVFEFPRVIGSVV